ncbi:MAG: hypothetical protein LBE31_05365 [Deltaproteobacteria bacterium]|nr:hypothetical protein [Deltaproteobacteria bacterium]
MKLKVLPLAGLDTGGDGCEGGSLKGGRPKGLGVGVGLGVGADLGVGVGLGEAVGAVLGVGEVEAVGEGACFGGSGWEFF